MPFIQVSSEYVSRINFTHRSVEVKRLDGVDGRLLWVSLSRTYFVFYLILITVTVSRVFLSFELIRLILLIMSRQFSIIGIFVEA